MPLLANSNISSPNLNHSPLEQVKIIVVSGTEGGKGISVVGVVESSVKFIHLGNPSTISKDLPGCKSS